MIIENQSTATRGLSLLLLSVPFAGLWAGGLLCPLAGPEQAERTVELSLMLGSALAAIGSFLVLRAATKGAGASVGVLIAAGALFGLTVLSPLVTGQLSVMLERRINPAGIYLVGLACLLGFLRPVIEEAGMVRHVGDRLVRWRVQCLIVTVVVAVVGLWQVTSSSTPWIAYGGCFLGQIVLLGWGLKLRRKFRAELSTTVGPSDSAAALQIAGVAKLLAGLAWWVVIVVSTVRHWPNYESELLFRILFAFFAAVSGAFAVIAILSGVSDLLGRALKRSVRWGLIGVVTLAICAAIYVTESLGRSVRMKEYEAAHPRSQPQKAKPFDPNDPANGARPRDIPPAAEKKMESAK